jgi:hypothetical protein
MTCGDSPVILYKNTLLVTNGGYAENIDFNKGIIND